MSADTLAARIRERARAAGFSEWLLDSVRDFAISEITLHAQILDLVATDELFVQPAEGGGWVFWVNVNDMFYPASDGEGIDESEIPAVWKAWKERGWPGVVRWVQEKRSGMKLRKSREETILTIEALQKRVSELSAAEQAERERCCADVCHHCRSKSDKYITRAKKVDGKWIHEEVGFEKERGGFDCYAAAIRNRE